MRHDDATATHTRSWTWVWAMGVQTWLVWVVGPRLYRGALGVADLLPTLLPPLMLGVAGWAMRRRTAHTFVVWCVLAAFPTSLAVAVSGLDPQLALTTYSPPVLCLGAASLLAFAATAASASSHPPVLRATSAQPLGESHLAATDPRQARGQALLLWGSAGALLALLVWGSWDTALAYHDAWGSAAAGGATLVAVAAGLTGAVAMAGVVGPGLRAERPRGAPARHEARRMRRVTMLMLVAVSGALAYAVMVWNTR